MASQTRSEKLVTARLKQLSTCPDEIIPKEKLKKFKVKMISLNVEDPVCLYFRPLSVKFLEDHAPRSGSIASIEKPDPEFFKLREYDAEAARAASTRQEKAFWSPSACTQSITQVLENLIYHLPRHNLGGRGWALAHFVCWNSAERPATLSNAYDLSYENLSDHFHRVTEIFEVDKLIYPHVVMMVEHHTPDVPSDNSMICHELAYILRAMEVLMLSFVAEQQGRIIEAYIEDQSQIVVACSRLYSFAKNKDAPFKLFYRWLLGNPIGVDPYPDREESEKD